jgi:hypothetical protein
MPAPRLTRRQLDALRGGGWAPTEAEFQTMLIRFAQLNGCRVHHQRPGLMRSGKWCSAIQGDPGFPDTVISKGRRVWMWELKVGDNPPTPDQLRWLEAFRRAGIPADVLRPSDWAKVEEVLAETQA